MGTHTIKNQTTPSTPASCYTKIFVDSADKHLKTVDDTGTVVDLASGGGLSDAPSDGCLYARCDGDWCSFNPSGGSGDVVGPSCAVDNNFASFDCTTGKLIKDSGCSPASFIASTCAGCFVPFNCAAGDVNLNNQDLSNVNYLQLNGEVGIGDVYGGNEKASLSNMGCYARFMIGKDRTDIESCDDTVRSWQIYPVDEAGCDGYVKNLIVKDVNGYGYLLTERIRVSDLNCIGFVKTSCTDGTLAVDTGSYLTDAPSDSSLYARCNGAWCTVPAPGIAEAPGDGCFYARKDCTWCAFTTGGSGGASAFTDLSDVPAAYTSADGCFVRVNATCTGLEFVAPPAGTGDVVGPATATCLNFAAFDGTTGKLICDSGCSASCFLTDAPNDSCTYGRCGAAWCAIAPGLTDAPSNGSIYGRCDGGWCVVTGGGGTNFWAEDCCSMNGDYWLNPILYCDGCCNHERSVHICKTCTCEPTCLQFHINDGCSCARTNVYNSNCGALALQNKCLEYSSSCYITNLAPWSRKDNMSLGDTCLQDGDVLTWDCTSNTWYGAAGGSGASLWNSCDCTVDNKYYVYPDQYEDGCCCYDRSVVVCKDDCSNCTCLCFSTCCYMNCCPTETSITNNSDTGYFKLYDSKFCSTSTCPWTCFNPWSRKQDTMFGDCPVQCGDTLKYCGTDGTWYAASAGGGGGSSCGCCYEIQYADGSGGFLASEQLSYNPLTGCLTILDCMCQCGMSINNSCGAWIFDSNKGGCYCSAGFMFNVHSCGCESKFVINDGNTYGGRQLTYEPACDTLKMEGYCCSCGCFGLKDCGIGLWDNCANNYMLANYCGQSKAQVGIPCGNYYSLQDGQCGYGGCDLFFNINKATSGCGNHYAQLNFTGCACGGVVNSCSGPLILASCGCAGLSIGSTGEITTMAYLNINAGLCMCGSPTLNGWVQLTTLNNSTAGCIQFCNGIPICYTTQD
jgi:hypothetical protein